MREKVHLQMKQQDVTRMKVAEIVRKRVGAMLILAVSTLVPMADSFFVGSWKTARQRSSARQAYDLNSAFEWLSEVRCDSPGYNNIKWLDLGAAALNQTGKVQPGKDGTLSTMPLYPLGAVYLPGPANHTLNNVEPQNLQMARDLLADDGSGAPPRFCVTLRAFDSGRIANIGAVLRILDAEEQFQDDKLVRIRLTCLAEDLVEICEIVNPEAFERENRIRKSSEYLKARVRPRIAEDNIGMDKDLEEVIAAMVNSYNMIKTIYQLQIGSDGFPPSTLFRLGNAMSTWDAITNFASEHSFWEAAQEWQSVCYTIRQGKQAMLSINRNEVMVEEASKLGPLKLPIHIEELPPHVQRQIQLMEVDAQKEYFQIEMDPCLDFQAMVSLPSHKERVLCLVQMISREKRRLEAVATESSRKARV